MIELSGMSRNVCDQFEEERMIDDRNNEFFEWMRMISFVKIDEQQCDCCGRCNIRKIWMKEKNAWKSVPSLNDLFQIVYSLLNMIFKRNTAY